MTPEEFNELYKLTYTKHEEIPMAMLEGSTEGHWLNYSKQTVFIQVNVTKEGDKNYWDTYRGDSLKEIEQNIIKKYGIEFK